MTVNVETLEKLERKITLTLPAETITKEVENRLKRLARQVKMDGFRPGKVPMNVVDPALVVTNCLGVPEVQWTISPAVHVERNSQVLVPQTANWMIC